MTTQKIEFFYEVGGFKLHEESMLRTWLNKSCMLESYKLEHLNFIYCDDEYLLKMNKEYLNHDYYTDIITFDNSEDEGVIEGDIFISVDRAKDNAKNFEQDFMREIERLMIHGLLHLIGYADKSNEEKSQMTAKEDYYLSILDKT